MINCLQTVFYSNPVLLAAASSSSSSLFRNHFSVYPNGIKQFNSNCFRNTKILQRNPGNFAVKALPFPVDPWSPTIDSQSIASQLFAFSLFPYIGFLYFITRSNSAPKLTLFGFYFLLAFVGATSFLLSNLFAALLSSPGRNLRLYIKGTKVHYGTSLSNVDWLHGGAESLLTLTNLFIVIGLRQALRKVNQAKELVPDAVTEVTDDNSPST
ncbi:hypothetical protein SSX86_009395 [Deinandra increscens subsp. villosa]|uniref:Uncharacterized protein n=1 Tax=Deinandra increscens subsp. villosa TaxID=3103831 RepID=A0AAP0H4T7_9ASTR